MIQGFSKLTKAQKREWLYETYLKEEAEKGIFEQYDNATPSLQQLHDEFTENTIANYYLPLSIAPNFCINGRYFNVPMVIEESSVVAAVSKVAKFWSERGGFHTEILGTEKIGQVHFFFQGEKSVLVAFFDEILPIFYADTETITKNMRQRGGGITKIELRDRSEEVENYYQIHATFQTLDAMGANFINSCLEQFAKTLEREAEQRKLEHLEVLMSILSNYVPNCLVKSAVSCPISALNYNKTEGNVFVRRFQQAVSVANAEIHRAVTHNKGILNGIDAVILATGNDFRAVEAGIHAYASRNGRYESLTRAYVEGNSFHFEIQVPLAVGTVGGLTKLHPMVKTALKILENPSAETLMEIVASVGLAQNFAAVGALITSGIQKGHMKMHLNNILNQLGATDIQKEKAIKYFADKEITFSEVATYLQTL